MKRLLYPTLCIAVVLFAVTAGYFLFNTKTSAPEPRDKPDTSIKDEEVVCPAVAGAGRYVDYTNNLFDTKCSGYSQTILFFFASWCPECRGFEKAILAGEIPDATQIVKVDYDSSQDLRKKYGVTIQSTFVSVDMNGDKLKLWSGYGKDKSVDAIIEHTK